MTMIVVGVAIFATAACVFAWLADKARAERERSEHERAAVTMRGTVRAKRPNYRWPFLS